jgi:protein-arginine kinase
MPRPKGPAVTTAYLSPQNLSTAESSAYTRLCKRRGIEENRKVRVLTRFIIVAALGIQQSTAALLVNKLNELAVKLREDRTEIDHLRRQLSIMRKPVRLIDFSTSLRFPFTP